MDIDCVGIGTYSHDPRIVVTEVLTLVSQSHSVVVFEKACGPTWTKGEVVIDVSNSIMGYEVIFPVWRRGDGPHFFQIWWE